MYKLTLLLIPLLLLSSCTIDWNDEKDKKIAELEKQVQDKTFQKKQECSKIINSIENSWAVLDIFYSSVRNSCLYRTLEWENQIIIDFYTKEPIFKNIQFSNEKEFFEKLKELKWE